MIEQEIIQGTEAWMRMRAGKATASRFKDVLAKIKSGEAATRRNYKTELVVQRLTNQIPESYTNTAIQWGTDHEEEARLAYEEFSCNLVEEVSFIDHPELMAGCSPDGLIDLDGGLEIKNPYQTAIHIETLREGLPSGHIAQIQGSMWITGRQWWDFVSYDCRLKDAGLALYVQRVERDEKYITTLAQEVADFLGEVDLMMADLQAISKLRDAA